nr:MAG TPA: hypothetical protein [Caudoviricetes sp.]
MIFDKISFMTESASIIDSLFGSFLLVSSFPVLYRAILAKS